MYTYNKNVQGLRIVSIGEDSPQVSFHSTNSFNVIQIYIPKRNPAKSSDDLIKRKLSWGEGGHRLQYIPD